MNAKDIAARLALRAESVCEVLLPGGKRDGGRWVAGNVHGDSGDSLRVELGGSKAGIWCDFADDGMKGDLLDLWRECRAISMAETIQQAKNWLGIKDVEFEPRQRKHYAKAQRPDCSKPKGESPVMAYLVGRGLRPETVGKFKIGEKEGVMVLPYMHGDTLKHVKYLALERDTEGKKKTWTSKGTEPCLFGWQAMPETQRAVVITEGEIDAMSISQVGIYALSVPMGGGGKGKQNWIETEWQNLERFDTIFLAMDNDEQGELAAREILERLGRHRCRLVKWPEGIKDANQALQQGWGVKEFSNVIMSARSIDPDELKNASEFREPVLLEFFPPSGVPEGMQTPWLKTKDKLLFRPAEASIWTGINGHGKSELLGQIIVDGIRQGERACIASMEMPARRTLYRMVRQASALERPSESFINTTIDWLAESLWLFDVVGTAKTERLIDVFTYARHRYNVTQFVVDSLAKCGMAEDDYNAQKLFVERLVDFAHEHNAHVHLVAHARKSRDEFEPPGKMDVRGTAAITDMVDNVFTVWRNKRKEDQISQLEPGEEPTPDVLEKPDAAVIVSKQRFSGWEDKIWLWFDHASLQYLGKPNGKPFRYVGYSAQEAA